jgi:hypothetical protein
VQEAKMTDRDQAVMARIDQLVDEEHALERRQSTGEALSGEERARRAALEVQLDQLWDLLRQRRARRAAGLDPELAEERPETVVERYRQ